MPKPAKPPIPKFRDWSEADAAGVELLKLKTAIDTAEAGLAAAVAVAKERHKAAIQQPTLEKALLLDGIEQFVLAHRSEIEGQSRALTHVVVGFRKRPPSVAKVIDTWDDVLKRAISLGKGFARFLRHKTELDKGAILKAAAEGTVGAKDLAGLGVAIDNTSEDFFCEAIAATVAAPN